MFRTGIYQSKAFRKLEDSLQSLKTISRNKWRQLLRHLYSHGQFSTKKTIIHPQLLELDLFDFDMYSNKLAFFNSDTCPSKYIRPALVFDSLTANERRLY